MSQISSKDIKKLRDSTGAGFMDCKKALEETKSDFDLAIDWLRKNGISAAKKKISRTWRNMVVGKQSYYSNKLIHAK